MRAALLLSVSLMSGPVFAVQQPLVTVHGSEPGEGFGSRLDGGADVDGDGHDDLLIAATGYGVQATGAVAVVSGQDGHVIHFFVGDGINDLFGIDAGFAGDADVDGVPDIIASARFGYPFGPTYAKLFSGADAHVLQTFLPQPEDGDYPNFESVDGLGDVNGDGASDIVLLATTSDGSPHHYRLYSGADGALLFGEPTDFASIVRGVGDADADGAPDFVVGHPDASLAGPFSGAARLHSGVDGTLLQLWTGDAAWDHFAEGLQAAGDVNGDGHADVAVGAKQWGPIGDGPGYVRVFSGLDGTVLRAWAGNLQQHSFGWSVAGAGDVDADGWPELLIGSGNDADLVHDGGSVRVQSGLDGSLLYQFAQGTGPFPSSAPFILFSAAVSTAGDADADGLADVALADPEGLVAGESVGTVWSFAGRDLVWHAVAWPVDPPGTPSVLSASGALDDEGEVAVMLTGAAQESPVVLVVGTAQLGVIFHGYPWIPTPDVLLNAGSTSGGGALALHEHWTGALPSGTHIIMQAWILSPTGVFCSNAVDATSP